MHEYLWHFSSRACGPPRITGNPENYHSNRITIATRLDPLCVVGINTTDFLTKNTEGNTNHSIYLFSAISGLVNALSMKSHQAGGREG